MTENRLAIVEKLIREKKIDKAQLELSKLGPEFLKDTEYLKTRLICLRTKFLVDCMVILSFA